MKNVRRSLGLLSMSLLLAACGQNPATSNATPSDTTLKTLQASDIQTNPIEGQWLIELEADPTAISAQSVTGQQASFRAQAQRLGIAYKELFQYQTLFNGFAVETTRADIRRLSKLKGVKAVYPVLNIPAPKIEHANHQGTNPNGEEAEMFYARKITSADTAGKELGLTGKGVKVGVIDTGIDMEHPAFKGRIVKAVDFAGDRYGADDPNGRIPDPGPTPQDCQGHGTHVAGIIGGNDPNFAPTAEGGTFSGVAPEVQLGVYRVFGCQGGTSNALTIKALERAYLDGMQVINLSLGQDYNGWSSGADAIVASRLVKKGVVVVAAAGNAGDSGSYSLGSPSTGDNVISVASLDNTNTVTPYMLVGDAGDKTQINYKIIGGSPAIERNSYELIKLNEGFENGCLPRDAQAAIIPNLPALGYVGLPVTGKVVLVERGTCTYQEKIENAEKAGAAAVIVYNNVDADTSPGANGVEIPGMFVSQKDGEKLIDYAGQHIEFTGKVVTTPLATANTLSNFSAYGLSSTLGFKPDISAPGGEILSTYPRKLSENALFKEGYDTLGGTSMAAPHVAGLVALLLQADHTIEAKEVRGILMNSASTVKYRGKDGAILDKADYVERQGAGLANIMAAYRARMIDKVSISPSKLELMDSAHYPKNEKVLTVTNNSNTDLVYKVRHVPALTVAGNTYQPVPDESTASMSINGTNVDQNALEITVPAHSYTELNVAVTPAANAPKLSQYGGFVVLESVGKSDLVVPYAGLNGNIFDHTVIGEITRYKAKDEAYTLKTPYLIDIVDKQLRVYERDAKPSQMPLYSMANVKFRSGKGYRVIQDIPRIGVNFAHQISSLILEIVDSRTGQAYLIGERSDIPRHCTNDQAHVNPRCEMVDDFEWDGKLDDQIAPDGIYQFRVTAVKPLGTRGVEGEEEVYTSPQFVIKRDYTEPVQ